MHQRRPPGVSPLAIVLPHPPLPRRRSSLLSIDSNGSGPRTPRSCGSPVASAIFCAPSRRSTDSWNSSNADELEWEWKPDQVKLLSRTLDALPAHLVTPFNGPIPPANLLDKIARGVSQAKGPIEWPHSLRATRVKLIELSRLKAKEEAQAEQRRNQIPEEPEVEIADGESNYSYMQDNIERPVGIAGRRPMYRQSSMDFLDPAGADIKQSDSIARLSRRLQRSERVFSNPGFHPYSRGSLHGRRRSTSPPPLTHMPSLISPSSQSSDTVDSLGSFGSDPGAKRRSVSSISSMSVISDENASIALPDPRLQRIKRSGSFAMGAPALPPKDRVKPGSALKRVPSYGVMAQEVRREHVASHGTRARRDSGSYPSSDEEEKLRTKQAKKQRTKTPPTAPQSPVNAPSTPPPVPASPTRKAAAKATPSAAPPVPEKDRTYVRGRSKTGATLRDENMKSPESPAKAKKAAKVEGSTKRPAERRSGMNLQRNPSMFGPELPKLPKAPVQAIPSSPVRPRGGLALPPRAFSPTPSPAAAPLSPLTLSPAAPIVPTTPLSPSPQMKTLRRVKRLAPGRRISFGSLLGGGDDDVRRESDQRSCLGSAFQLL